MHCLVEVFRFKIIAPIKQIINILTNKNLLVFMLTKAPLQIHLKMTLETQEFSREEHL